MFPMATQTRKRTYSDVIKKEIDPDFSREAITIASGAGILDIGTVLGQITASGKYVLHNNAANDGSEVAAGVLGEAVDATNNDVMALGVTWGAIVVLPALTFKNGISNANKAAAIAALAAKKILVRDV
ncbi:head decoration protein [Bosea sp. (in: a-proteobacteria)]|uniref:head decoration protein n=1 Tax=Bosea sp. (in: a-proteobacteria) TaxID=1871050 RepID=UPI003B3A8FE2